MKRKRGMIAALIRLLTIAALVLMPLGMLGTPAMAVDHAPAAASVPCESHGEPSKDQHDNRTHCTSCVAIAEPDTPVALVAIRPMRNLSDRTAPFRLGHSNDVATPPPKTA